MLAWPGRVLWLISYVCVERERGGLRNEYHICIIFMEGACVGGKCFPVQTKWTSSHIWAWQAQITMFLAFLPAFPISLNLSSILKISIYYVFLSPIPQGMDFSSYSTLGGGKTVTHSNASEPRLLSSSQLQKASFLHYALWALNNTYATTVCYQIKWTGWSGVGQGQISWKMRLHLVKRFLALWCLGYFIWLLLTGRPFREREIQGSE